MPEVRAAIRQNVWIDLAATPYLYQPSGLRAAADGIGEDRLLFATDYPLLTVARCRRELATAGLESAAVLGLNARDLLGL
jgi:predicted TIM-barrel fold metal-dependent hydrolase